MSHFPPPISLTKLTRLILSFWGLVALFMSGVLVTTPSFAANLSGSYLGKGEQLVVFLQLVQTDDGKVVGRLRQSLLRPTGEVRSFDASLSGAANGDQFVGKLERSSVLGSDAAISGQLEGNRLLLQGPGEQRVHLQWGQEAEYRKSVTALQTEASALRQTAAAREKQKRAEQVLKNAAERIDRLIGRTAAFAEKEPRTVAQLSSTAQKYEEVSARMVALVSSLRETAGQSAEAISKRSSLGASTLHTSIEAEHTRITVDHARGDFESEASYLARALADATKACAETVPSSFDAEAFRRACGQVPNSVRMQEQVKQDVSKAYAKLEESWRKERLRQEALLREAQALQQYQGQR